MAERSPAGKIIDNHCAQVSACAERIACLLEADIFPAAEKKSAQQYLKVITQLTEALSKALSPDIESLRKIHKAESAAKELHLIFARIEPFSIDTPAQFEWSDRFLLAKQDFIKLEEECRELGFAFEEVRRNRMLGGNLPNLYIQSPKSTTPTR